MKDKKLNKPVNINMSFEETMKRLSHVDKKKVDKKMEQHKQPKKKWK
jgi:hypothetical protein